MRQTITIEHLECEAMIGVNAEELMDTQPIILHLQMEFDAGDAIASDHVADTLDYDAISHRIRDYVASHRFGLLERLAQALLEELAQYPRLQAAAVTIQKPKALEALGAMVSLSAEWERRA